MVTSGENIKVNFGLFILSKLLFNKEYIVKYCFEKLRRKMGNTQFSQNVKSKCWKRRGWYRWDWNIFLEHSLSWPETHHSSFLNYFISSTWLLPLIPGKAGKERECRYISPGGCGSLPGMLLSYVPNYPILSNQVIYVILKWKWVKMTLCQTFKKTGSINSILHPPWQNKTEEKIYFSHLFCSSLILGVHENYPSLMSRNCLMCKHPCTLIHLVYL